MTDGLNLLPSEAKFQAAKIKLRKKVYSFMAIFAGCWVLLIVIIFAWLIVNKTLLANVEKKYQRTLNEYKTLANNVVLTQKIKYQAKLVGKVLNERFEYGESIKNINSIFSNNIDLDSFEIKDKNKFTLTGVLNDGKFMDEVEEKLLEINNGKMDDFKSAKLTSIAVGLDNKWTFEMEVFIK